MAAGDRPQSLLDKWIPAFAGVTGPLPNHLWHQPPAASDFAESHADGESTGKFGMAHVNPTLFIEELVQATIVLIMTTH